MRSLLIFLFLTLTSGIVLGAESDWLNEEISKNNSNSEIGVIFHSTDNQQINASIRITLDEGWKTYFKNEENIDNALNLSWDNSKNVKDIKITWSKPEKFIEQVTDEFTLEILGYKDEVIFPIAIIPANPNQKGILNLKAKYTVCNKICIPQEAEFNLTLPKVADSASSVSPASWVCFILPIGFAFVGGLILNIMPCVLPVLSIKILGIAEHSGKEITLIRKNFLALSLGIITSFAGLALITALLKNAGTAVGWGVHFQQPVFIIILILMIGLFAANLWGLFEIRLPHWLSSLTAKETSNGIAGNFITGIFTTIIATPCSAPFLGTAIGFALAHGTFEIFLIFITMGIGLAFPFITVALFPEFASKLPKPGAWMIKVKYFLGFLLALTALWLMWVLSSQAGNSVSFIIAGIFLAVITVLHFVKTPSLKAFIIICLFGAGIALPSIIDFDITAEQNIKKQGLWKEFDRQKIPFFINQGKVVVVNVTADWCLTCKTNKVLVLNSDRIKELLKSEEVVAMQANWTNPNEEIRQFLEDNNRYGIPFNIVYGKNHPEGVVLSELLTEEELIKAVERVR